MKRTCCICGEAVTIRLKNYQAVCGLHGLDHLEWLKARGHRNDRRAADQYVREQRRARASG